MKLFDTHAHLNNPILFENLDEVVQNAIENNVGKMICIGYDLKTSKQAIEIARKYPGIVYASVGIHPTECYNLDDLAEIEKLLTYPEVVALGEIGLDYYWDNIKPEVQKDFFKRQIVLAKKYHKIISIHSRDAIQDTYDILKESDIKEIKGIMHSYSGSLEMAQQFIGLGMYLSISGVITFKNAKKTREVVKEIDLKNILIETDCPYLTPQPYRGKTNYPQYTYYVAQEIALVKEIDISEVIETTYNNALEAFKLI